MISIKMIRVFVNAAAASVLARLRLLCTLGLHSLADSVCVAARARARVRTSTNVNMC
jgi:hypothetical protein